MAETGEHGRDAPFDPSRSALLVIDMLNDLEFEGGEALLEQAMPVASAIAHLRGWYHARGLPVISFGICGFPMFPSELATPSLCVQMELAEGFEPPTG